MSGRYYWLYLALLLQTNCNEEDKVIVVADMPFVRLLEHQQLQSAILNRPVDYAVLLPEDYDSVEQSYPVVYLLHGYGENETAWYTSGNIQAYVDAYIAETVPMIYVMPQGLNRYYIDKYNGGYAYMQMFVDELVPTIDEKFRTKKDRTQRAVMGYSMGGYGALILPAMNPDVFTISIPLSMSFRTDEQYIAESQDSFDAQWAPNFGPNPGASGTARLTDYFKARSPFYFFDQDNLTDYSELKILIDCGDDEESLSHTNDNLHTLMREREVAHEYRVRNGGHSFDYWRKSYREALMFISNAVQGIKHPAEPEAVSIGTFITSSDYESFISSGLMLNVLKPVDYETGTTDYPVLYFIHDYEGSNRTEKVIEVFSLLRNAMIANKLPKSIIVEIPVAETIAIEDIISTVDATYRTKEERGKRVLMGNALGGKQVATIISENSDLIGSCYLFSAELTEQPINTSAGVFYYLDITDDGNNYKSYHNLYLKIRDEGMDYEYRVRQGGESYQSFLNGLGESFSILKKTLTN